MEYPCACARPGERVFILCDPMVATGYSAVHAVDVMKRRNVHGENIILVALVAAAGSVVFADAHPDVKLYVASLDSHLNEHAYIACRSLGDAGDRLFGTKN